MTYLARGSPSVATRRRSWQATSRAARSRWRFVAERAGVEIVRLPGLSRELSPVPRRGRRVAARADHPAGPAGRRPHAHGEGRRDRAGRGAARRAAAAPVVVHTFHGHVLRGYFGRAGTLVFRAIETVARPRDRPSRRGQPRGPRRARRAARSRRARSSTVIRLGIELEPRVALRRRPPRSCAGGTGSRADKFVVGWFGRMTAVKRTDDLLTMLAALRERGVDALLLLVGDGDDRERARAAGARARARPLVPLPRLPGGRRAAGTRSATRSCSRRRARARP